MAEAWPYATTNADCWWQQNCPYVQHPVEVPNGTVFFPPVPEETEISALLAIARAIADLTAAVRELVASSVKKP